MNKPNWKKELAYRLWQYDSRIDGDEKLAKKYWQGKWEDFINEILSQQRQEIINEIIELSDKIEAESGTTEFEEWRAFKGFRNQMRDKLKLSEHEN